MMKEFKILLMVLSMGVFATSCRDDVSGLGEMPDTSNIQYSITQDYDVDAGGNTVIVELLSDGVLPIWEYESGKSTSVLDTFQFPFAGDYVISLSVETRAGILDIDSVTLSVTENNFEYLSDDLWTYLTGGVGESKTWVADTGGFYFNGPMYFYGSDNGWLHDGDEFEGGSDLGCYGSDCWIWDIGADEAYSGGYVEQGDWGTMTFSLIDGAKFTDVKPLEGGIEESSSFFLDADNKTLSITDASILRSYKPNVDGIDGISDWNNYVVFELTEDVMQLGVYRDQDVDGEGVCMLVYNFISEDYSESYESDGEEESTVDDGYLPEFETGELLEMLTGGESGRIWVLDGDGNPVDWVAAGVGWTSSASDSYDWGWNDDWAAAASNSWILFSQVNGTQTYTLSQDGVTTSSTFTIDEETNEITLGGTNTLINDGGNGSWINPTTNVITVVKGFPDSYEEDGIWFGTSYTEDSDQWLVFHYIIP